METKLAFSAEANNLDSSDGLEINPRLGTGLAWDSYNVNRENLNGKDTLRAAFGMCYQNISPINSSREGKEESTITGVRRGRRS